MRKLSFIFIALFCYAAYAEEAFPEMPKNELTEKAHSKYTKPQESRDPFGLPATLAKKLRSAGVSKGAWPELKLYGIIFGEEGIEPRALINNEVASVGDSIGPAKVIEIRKDSVKVELDGEFRILTIDK